MSTVEQLKSLYAAEQDRKQVELREEKFRIKMAEESDVAAIRAKYKAEWDKRRREITDAHDAVVAREIARYALTTMEVQEVIRTNSWSKVRRFRELAGQAKPSAPVKVDTALETFRYVIAGERPGTFGPDPVFDIESDAYGPAKGFLDSASEDYRITGEDAYPWKLFTQFVRDKYRAGEAGFTSHVWEDLVLPYEEANGRMMWAD